MPFIASLLASSLAFAVQSEPATRGESGAIRITLDVRVDGTRQTCRGATLVPATPAYTRQIESAFGAAPAARLINFGELTLRRDGEDHPVPAGIRTSSCYLPGARSFGFRNVDPGDYFLIVGLAPVSMRTDPVSGFERRGVDLLRRVRVEAGQEVHADFKTRDALAALNR